MNEMLGWILFGLVLGGAALALAYTVSEVIRRTNIGSIIKNALRNAQNEVAKKMLGGTIKAKIKSKGINVVSVDAIDEVTGEVIELNITSETGVDDSIHTADVYQICA